MRENQSKRFEKDVAFKQISGTEKKNGERKKNGRGVFVVWRLPINTSLLLFVQKVPKFRRLSCCKHKDFQHKCIFCFFFPLKYKLFCVGNFNLFAQGIVPEYRCNFETVLPILPPKLSCRFYSFRYFNLSFLLFFNWILN